MVNDLMELDDLKEGDIIARKIDDIHYEISSMVRGKAVFVGKHLIDDSNIISKEHHFIGDLSTGQSVYRLKEALSESVNNAEIVNVINVSDKAVTKGNVATSKTVQKQKKRYKKMNDDTVLTNLTASEFLPSSIVHQIALHDIDADNKTFQVRKSLDMSTVDILALVPSKDIPPIKLVVRDGKNIIVSGFHRYEAAKKRGDITIGASFISNDKDVVLRLKAYADNSQQARELTRAEKEAYTILYCTTFPDVPHHKIAPLVGLTDKTVTKVMKTYNRKEQEKILNELKQSETPEKVAEVQEIEQKLEAEKEKAELDKLVGIGKSLLKAIKTYNALDGENKTLILKTLVEHAENKTVLEEFVADLVDYID